MGKSRGKLYTPTSDFIADVGDGTPAVMSKGKTRVREGHPILVRYPNDFEEASADYDVEDAAVEQATSSVSKSGGRRARPARAPRSPRQQSRQKVAQKVKGAAPDALDNPDPPSGDGPKGNDGPIAEQSVGDAEAVADSNKTGKAGKG